MRVFVEINYSPKTRIARLFVQGNRTPFYADGYGYCKESTVLGQFLNYWMGKEISPTCGCGVDKIEQVAKENGACVSFVCETKEGKIYRFKKEK